MTITFKLLSVSCVGVVVLNVLSFFYNQVGAKMGESTRPVYWGRTVIPGHYGRGYA